MLKKSLVYILFFISGFLLSLLYFKLQPKLPNFVNVLNQITYSSSEYKYISPLLGCTEINIDQPNNVKSLTREIETLTNNSINEDKITAASVYFRDLNNGPWIFTGEENKFAPASLFKITTLMTYLSLAENDPSLLNKNILNELDEKLIKSEYQNIRPTQVLEPGKSYTIENLIERMIKYSDNLSYDNLLSYLEKNYPNDVNITERAFGFTQEILDESASNGGNFISPKDYSSFFRALYNSTYLSNKYSNAALKLMTESEYAEGLRKTVPNNIPVSHKFGERGYTDNDMKQLHDCGIIYAENKPYFLCVMTKGDDFTRQSNFIKAVSKLVYDRYILNK